jgi:hypothetical protein
MSGISGGNRLVTLAAMQVGAVLLCVAAAILMIAVLGAVVIANRRRGGPFVRRSDRRHGREVATRPGQLHTNVFDFAAGVPICVRWPCTTQVTAELWGGGGGGGGNSTSPGNFTAASGGGAGYVIATFHAAPGQTYVLVVGAPGLGGQDSVASLPGSLGDGTAGGTTSILEKCDGDDALLIRAFGGGFGQGFSNATVSGGIGGGGAVTGCAKYSISPGTAGSMATELGFGAGGGSARAGGAGSTFQGFIPQTGGTPGGGGAGGGTVGIFGQPFAKAGAGGPGQIKLSYDSITPVHILRNHADD